MRRKSGSLIPLEASICTAAADLAEVGIDEFHGYELAKRLAADDDRRLLTAHGTLYRALSRLENMGFLKSRREDARIAARENRPGRRFYKLTATGAAAAAGARATVPGGAPRRRRVVPV